jgi:Zn-dependent protease
MEKLPQFLVWYLVFVFSTTCHEAAHAFVAHRGGDSTAYSQGHVTLDPLPHIRREPFGMVLVPIVAFWMWGYVIGWASVPFDPFWGARHPRRYAFMSLVGPGANFLLALIALISIRVLSSAGVFHLSDYGGTTVGFVQLPQGHELNSPLGALALGLSVMLQLNVILGIFNLLPIPPLDGAAVVQGFGPAPVRHFYERIRMNPAISMLGLLVAWLIFPSLIGPAIRLLALALYS